MQISIIGFLYSTLIDFNNTVEMKRNGRKGNAIARTIVHYEYNLHDTFPLRRHFFPFISSVPKLQQAASAQGVILAFQSRFLYRKRKM